MERDSSNNKNSTDWLNRVKQWAGGLATVLNALTLLLGLVGTIRDEPVVNTWILVGVWLVSLEVILIYIYRRRVTRYERFGTPQEGYYYSSRVRTYALLGAIAVPLFVGVGFSIWKYIESLPPEKVIVAVADFDGPSKSGTTDEYGVTETLISELRAATEAYDDVAVASLGEKITAREGSARARTLGEEKKASLVLWGWYKAPGNSVRLTLHVELLRGPKGLNLRNDRDTLTVALAELESFRLQLQLSEEMSYVTLLIVGLTRYEAGDFDGAVNRFTDALNQQSVPENFVDPENIYFYRGAAYSFKEEHDRAIADFDRAIELNPRFAKAYNNRGAAYNGKEEYDRAIADYDRAIELNPRFALAYYNRGLAYRGKEEYDRAVQDFRTASSLTSDPRIRAQVRRLMSGNGLLDR